MLDKLKYMTHKKSFHIVMLIVILAIILFVVGILILRYNVEGETNMPFKLTKISIISSSEGKDKETTDSKWAFDVYQSNDIYLYIDKNENYNGTDAISSILINNISIDSSSKDKLKIYRPDVEDENLIFKNDDKNIVSEIIYSGAMESNMKNLEISNQGGVIAFRASYDNLAEYKSNEDEINHQQLLQKMGITTEQLKGKLTFDFIIETESNRKYITNISIDIPVRDVVTDGITSTEITNMDDFIFKRLKNN